MNNHKNKNHEFALLQGIQHRLAVLMLMLIPLSQTACTTSTVQEVGIREDTTAENRPWDASQSTGTSASNTPGISNYSQLVTSLPDTDVPWLPLATQSEAEQPEINLNDPGLNTSNLTDEQTGTPPTQDTTLSGIEYNIESGIETPDGIETTQLAVNALPDAETDSGEEPTRNLWQRIRKDFKLPGKGHRFVKPYINWYAEHQAYLDRVVERARPFLYDIVEEIKARGMPMEIALLPVVESAFQPFAYSHGRAAGIWQFIPSTGRLFGLKQNWWYDGRRDVPAATKAALDYLERLHKRFDGDWLLALASYNSGEGRVANAVKHNKKKGRPIDFWSLDLPDETRGYVPKLLAISAIVAHASDFDVTLEPIADKPYLKRIDIGSQIDLAMAAELADLPIETMYKLNPAFNRWATDPKGPHTLSLPVDKADSFLEALAKVDKKDRIRWQRHRIQSGETLGQIARKYQTTVKVLQDVNNIDDKWIRAGKNIIIPVATINLKHYLSEDQRRLALQGTNRNGVKIKHTVRSGDTFWDISRKFKVNVRQLASWNGMSPRDKLMPGQKLVIWTKNRGITRARSAAPPSSATHQQLHYTVRKGDSLALIADKFSVTISKLRSWNSLPKGKYLQPGQRLTLYVDVTEQS